MSHTHELTDVNGIGPSSADDLEDAGFASPADIASADVEAISSVEGFGPDRAAEVIADAQTLEADEVTDGAEDVKDVEDVETEDTDEYYTLALRATDIELLHVLRSVLNEATQKHQNTEYEMRDTAYEVSRRLAKIVTETDTGETVDVTLELTKAELNSLYRALSSGSTDYASRRGFSEMYGKLESLRRTANDVRADAMAKD